MYVSSASIYKEAQTWLSSTVHRIPLSSRAKVLHNIVPWTRGISSSYFITRSISEIWKTSLIQILRKRKSLVISQTHSIMRYGSVPVRRYLTWNSDESKQYTIAWSYYYWLLFPHKHTNKLEYSGIPSKCTRTSSVEINFETLLPFSHFPIH